MGDVTQADREAAANLYLELEMGGGPYSPHDLAIADEHRRGLLDDHASVQAFAAHRIAERERCAAIAENVQTIARAVSKDHPRDMYTKGEINAAMRIAESIRNDHD